jgi:DNA polymerase-4
MIMARHITYLVMQIEVNPTTFYLKVNYEYGVKAKTSETINRLFSEYLFKSELSKMYDEIKFPSKGAVKITVNVSNFTMQHMKTFSLLDHEVDTQTHKLTQKMQALRKKFGLDIIKTANEL